MNTLSKLGLLVVSGLFLALVTGCQGGSSGSSTIPSTVGAGTAPQPLSPQDSPIRASCTVPIVEHVGQDVICRFNENGYQGMMTIDDDLNGIAAVRPHIAKVGDPFVVHGLKPGSGSFAVSDSMRHILSVSVTVPAEPVESSCGQSIRIHILGFVTCQFSEDFYNGTFKLDTSHLSGIATVSPQQGDEHTQFTVTGILEGGGYFTVTGDRSIRIHVQVTTP